MKKAFFARFACVAAFALSSVPVFAVPMQPAPDESVSQSTGLIQPGQATGFMRTGDFSHFQDGTLALCVNKGTWSQKCEEWLTPSQYVKRLNPKLQYVGFQLYVLKDGPQLYLFYR